MALDVPQDVSPPSYVERAPLETDHLGELGVVDAGGVGAMTGEVHAGQVDVGIELAAALAQHEPLVAAQHGARHEGAGLLDLELGVDAPGLPAPEIDLHRIE